MSRQIKTKTSQTKPTVKEIKPHGHSPFIFGREEEAPVETEPVEFFDDGEPEWRSFVMVSTEPIVTPVKHIAAQVNHRLKIDSEKAESELSEKFTKLREAGKERAAAKMQELSKLHKDHKKASAKRSKAGARKLVAAR